jgi:hypothetical protein
MKQHITIENLMELTEYQRDRLNDLWVPKRYDTAVGFLCKDAESNEYDVFEFVIGHVSIRETGAGYSMTLINHEALRELKKQEEAPEEEVDMEEFFEEEFVFEYQRPDIYSKGDCLPMLNIGQMLEILNKCGYGSGNFYVNFKKDDKECEIGRDIDRYLDLGIDHKGEELCDILWTALKEVL